MSLLSQASSSKEELREVAYVSKPHREGGASDLRRCVVGTMLYSSSVLRSRSPFSLNDGLNGRGRCRATVRPDYQRYARRTTGMRANLRAIGEGVMGALQVVGTLLLSPLIRSWYNWWGATLDYSKACSICWLLNFGRSRKDHSNV